MGEKKRLAKLLKCALMGVQYLDPSGETVGVIQYGIEGARTVGTGSHDDDVKNLVKAVVGV